MPYDKIVETIHALKPKDAEDMTQRCPIGRRCMMCIPFIEKYIKESRMSTIRFKEPQELVISVRTQFGVMSTSFKTSSETSYTAQVDVYGEFADILFTFDDGEFAAYAVPVDSFTVE
jgi:bacterioferritin-associated ferredoxin